METLIEILKKETESLKTQYISKTVEWATNNFNNIISDNRIYLHTPSGKYFINTHGKTLAENRAIKKLTIIANQGITKYVDDLRKDAELHYEHSIAKLAHRITDKNLDISKLKVTTSHIGVNIDTTLTDGTKKVNAFTILACGEIQRPHYRYLIK